MGCLFRHNWGWPRRRGDRHVQVCLGCGSERESLVQFDTPRVRKTQEPDQKLAVDASCDRERVVLANVA
jgi:hypothetical protein